MAKDVKRVNNENVPKGGPYTQVAVHNGTAYLSGIVGIGRGESKSFSEQWNTIAERAATLLDGVGSSLSSDTVKATVYLSSKEHFSELNKLYEGTFGGDAPARTTIICGFVADNIDVECDFIVAVK